MIDPTVCVIMLTSDRPQMLARAVKSWKAQTYRSRLLIWDTGLTPVQMDLFDLPACYSDGFTGAFNHRGVLGDSIGSARNRANYFASQPHIGFHPHDIIVHMDDDDWSHPYRIAEQVEFLQKSGADAVGYSTAVFWREPTKDKCEYCPSVGQAYFYTAQFADYPPLGASLCYWRKAWERRPFPDVSLGEDFAWLNGVRHVSVSSRHVSVSSLLTDPRIICGIHSSNVNAVNYEAMISGSLRRTLTPDRQNQLDQQWRRALEFDDVCHRVMSL
jgi:hypothetical protein